MQTTISRRKGPVCREKLVLVYLCMLLLAESYAPEPNPGPRTPKYPCGICRKTLKWTTPGVQCDSCKLWYHQECIYIPDEVYTALNNVSWECVQCSLPNFASNLFDITLFETSINNDPLQTDLGKSMAQEMSFNNPRATSSPNRCHTSPCGRLQSTFSTSLHTTFSDTGDPLLHPSFIDSRELQAINISNKQRTDIPLKVLSLNSQSIVGKKAPFETMCNTIGADIVIGTESWHRNCPK